jgi:hypothetical protein
MGIATALADRLRLPLIFGHELWRACAAASATFFVAFRGAHVASELAVAVGGTRLWTGRKGEEPSMHMLTEVIASALLHFSTAHGAHDSVVRATEEADGGPGSSTL